ncbi:MAG: hypothetical protein ACD_79C00751G0001 [uncultured bacterium]|nr:MAG: hypothetical protein ACD_79C00751G0001 [uncultured bacterium]
MAEQFLRVEKEQVVVEVTTPNQIVVGKFTKDKGIRLIDYFNRIDNQQGFIVLSEVEILDYSTRKQIAKKIFLAINVEYIVTFTQLEE